MSHPRASAFEARARRAARRVGLFAKKSRWRRGSVDNCGQFMLLDERNRIVAGERFDLAPEQVIYLCAEREC